MYATSFETTIWYLGLSDSMLPFRSQPTNAQPGRASATIVSFVPTVYLPDPAAKPRSDGETPTVTSFVATLSPFFGL